MARPPHSWVLPRRRHSRSLSRLPMPPVPDRTGSRQSRASRKLQKESPPGIFVPVRGELTHTLETSDPPPRFAGRVDGSIQATSLAQSRTPPWANPWGAHWRSLTRPHGQFPGKPQTISVAIFKAPGLTLTLTSRKLLLGGALRSLLFVYRARAQHRLSTFTGGLIPYPARPCDRILYSDS